MSKLTVTDGIESLSGLSTEFLRLRELQHSIAAEIADFSAADRLDRDDVHSRPGKSVH